MPVKIFQQLREKVEKQGEVIPAEHRAAFWFQDNTRALMHWQQKQQTLTFNRLQQADFTKQLVAPNKAFPGYFYFYMYDPKLKQELPFYDKFPFTLVLDVREDRFLGLNFHYLDYSNRARLFDALYTLREGRISRPTVRDIRMRLRLSYALLKSSAKYAPFKPCLKEYLFTHVRTPLVKVGAKEWDLAVFLPVESFEKQSKQAVWRDSQTKF